jgi:hypothetical protein
MRLPLFLHPHHSAPGALARLRRSGPGALRDPAGAGAALFTLAAGFAVLTDGQIAPGAVGGLCAAGLVVSIAAVARRQG